MNKKQQLITGLLAGIFLFCQCKKDFSANNGDMDSSALQLPSNIDVHIRYSAQEINYSTYKYPVGTEIEKSGKYLNTLPKTRTYDMQMDVSSGGMNFEMNNMSFDSPVESWNTNSNQIARMTNDGNYFAMYDKTGKVLFTQPSNVSQPTPVDIYNSFVGINDNRPIEFKIQELAAKGATIKETPQIYAVRTTFDNPNFKKNTVTVYTKSNSRLASYTEFEDRGSDLMKNNRFIHYDIAGNPVGIYSEVFTYLPDGDIEKAISITKLSNVFISFN